MTDAEVLLNATNALDSGRARGVRRRDGSTIIGNVFDYEDPMNDPDEIGYIAIEKRDGTVELAYANEITGIVE